MRFEAVRTALGQAERGGAAHRQAGKMRFVDSKRVHQRQRIVEQRVETIAPRRRIAAAVAALIVAQHPERGQRSPPGPPMPQDWSPANW